MKKIVIFVMLVLCITKLGFAGGGGKETDSSSDCYVDPEGTPYCHIELIPGSNINVELDDKSYEFSIVSIDEGFNSKAVISIDGVSTEVKRHKITISQGLEIDSISSYLSVYPNVNSYVSFRIREYDGGLDKCDSNSDCDDNDDSTQDVCSGSPKICSNIEITECITGDNYCPTDCNYDNDEDCTELDQCSSNVDCNDNDASTKDVCSDTPKKCSNIKIIECVTGDDYCPPNCDYEQDEDCLELDKCSTDSDCDDNGACTTDRCAGTPKKCSNERTSSGCDLNGNCVPVGTRSKDKYCDVDNSLKNQKTEDANCNNNYECASNICVNSNCIEANFIQKIINWFVRLFGTS